MWYKDICCILKEMVENNILVPKAWSGEIGASPPTWRR